MGRRTRVIGLAWTLLAASSLAAGAPPITVAVKRLGFNQVRITGQAIVQQPSAVVWRVLTNYDHLHEFIPGLLESRVVAQSPTRLFYQRGQGRWWIFSHTVEVTFEIEELPEQEIRFHAISGDFVQHDGAWRLESTDAGVRILYDATIHPRFFLPPILGRRLLKQQLRESLQAIVERVESVSAATASTTP